MLGADKGERERKKNSAQPFFCGYPNPRLSPPEAEAAGPRSTCIADHRNAVASLSLLFGPRRVLDVPVM